MIRILCRGRLLAALAITIGSIITGWTPATGATLTVGKAAPNADPIIPVNVGDKLGIFKKHGLDLTIVDFTGGSKMTQAMVAGSIDIGVGAAPDGVRCQGCTHDCDLRDRRAPLIPQYRCAVGLPDPLARPAQRQEDRRFYLRLVDRLAGEGPCAQKGMGTTSHHCGDYG